MFLTQYATSFDSEENKVYLADFPNQQSVEVYYSEVLNTDIVIDGLPPIETSGTGNFTLIFVYNNIMYLFEGIGYTNGEIIESMKF